MKYKAILLVIALVSLLAVGCTPAPADENNQGATTEASTDATTTEAVDVVTTASLVDNIGAFEYGISQEGTWIVSIIKNLESDNALVLDGDFENGKKEANGDVIMQRKISLYAQDADRNITARYTLVAPSLTVNSINASIQHGTFVGDIIVSGLNFKLVDTAVDGNIYFVTEEAKLTFLMDDSSSVTGVQEMKK